MFNFNYYTPTKVIFGKETENQIKRGGTPPQDYCVCPARAHQRRLHRTAFMGVRHVVQKERAHGYYVYLSARVLVRQL